MENKKQKARNIFTLIAIILLSVAVITMIILYSISLSDKQKLQTKLENVYQQNFCELVDNVNNAQIKLNKVCALKNDSYAEKLLNEISKNTLSASINLSSLPLSSSDLNQTIKFINQTSGFCETMANKLKNGEALSFDEQKTLQDLSVAFSEMKQKINSVSKDIFDGSILSESVKIDGDYNNFTLRLKNIKSDDVKYPTMIYDGPFSDSTVNRPIKGLNGETSSKEQAKQTIFDIFTNISESNCQYLGETNGKFKTYDFELLANENGSIYVQVTKQGACLLSLSAKSSFGDKKYTQKQAKQIAIDFAKQNKLENMQCVWSDVINSCAYINLAPIESGIIIYPDLVKVKVDLISGLVVGYEASTYYTNHIDRTLESVSVEKSLAQEKIPQDYKITKTNICLVPLDYNREVLCYEFVCTKDNETYYFYVNAKTSEVENILQVIETDNGNLLM